MAVLTTPQLSDSRQSVAKDVVAITYTKPQINAALQAIEDRFEATRSGFSSAIDTATSPFVFSAAQKKKLIAYWARIKFSIEVV